MEGMAVRAAKCSQLRHDLEDPLIAGIPVQAGECKLLRSYEWVAVIVAILINRISIGKGPSKQEVATATSSSVANVLQADGLGTLGSHHAHSKLQCTQRQVTTMLQWCDQIESVMSVAADGSQSPQLYMHLDNTSGRY